MDPPPKDAVEMSEEESIELEPGPAAVRGYLYRAVNLLAREICDRADADGGSISIAEVGKVLESFKRADSPVLGAICRAAWDDCGAIFESEGRGEDRKAPFQRLMVSPFAHLLPEDGSRDGAAGTLSRRIIPGYMAALEDLVGPVLFGRQQERSRELVRAARSARGGDFRWEEIYKNRHSQDIIDDTLVYLAGEFEEFERQRDWFIGLVNDAMPLPPNDSGHAVALDDDGFALLMNALYSRLAQTLATEAGTARLRERHGAAAINKAGALLARLDER
jgi:hypothetical protein